MPSKLKKQRKNKVNFSRLPRGANGGIELLLIQSVDNLGKQGEVVEVKPGFANNFLLPQGLATIASDHHKRMVDKHRAKLQEIEQSRLKDLKDLAKLISKQSITIELGCSPTTGCLSLDPNRKTGAAVP